MTNDDTFKTSLRLPKDLHAQIDRAATKAGISINAEMLLRLARNPHVDTAAVVLDEIRKRDSVAAESLSKQIDIMWGAMERADEVLERVQKAIARAPENSEAAALRRDVEFARQLIGAIGAHR
jgi:hypothetical protein